MKSFLMLCVLLLLGLTTASQADVGVYTGNGQDLRQISSKTVQLVSIDVTVVPGRGRFLFDGGVAGMDQVEYFCTFVLQNLTDGATEVQVGFPIDSQFAVEPKKDADPAESWNWVAQYGFIARDQKTTYHIDFVHRERTDDNGARATFSWKMNFAAKETRELHVMYRIPMSMSLAETWRKDAKRPNSGKSYWRQYLAGGLVEFTGYITETGSSWAGNVEKAKFTIATAPFEKYLTRRGFIEQPDDLSPEEAAKIKRQMPVQQCWWYRKVTPTGSKPAGETSLSWEYTDFKPKDPINIAYYLTQFPSTPEAADPFVDAIIRLMSNEERAKPGTVLATAREILLATWGREATDADALAFAKEQEWYEPRKEFKVETLTSRQRAVLMQFDKKVASIEERK